MRAKMETEEDSTPEADILHPDLLSKEEIINILKERCHLKITNPGQVDKGSLVSLFQRTVLPLPQRVPRGNRRGRRTKALIKRLDAKRPKPVDKPTKYQNPKRSPQVKTGLLISSDLNYLSGTRLKPPPIVINKKKAILSLRPSLSPPGNVSSIRTGISKVKINTTAGEVPHNTKQSTGNVTPGRTKITFSNNTNSSRTESSLESSTSEITVKGDRGSNVAIKKSIIKLPSDENQGLPNGKAGGSKRTYITFSDSNEKHSPTRSKVSVAAKDAVRKALLGNSGTSQNSQSSSSESEATKRSPVSAGEKGKEGSVNKRKKITWP